MEAITAFFTSFKYFIIGGAVIAIFAAGHHMGAQGVKEAWDKEKAAQTIADQTSLLLSQENVLTVERKHLLTTYGVSNDFQRHKAIIDGNYASILAGLQPENTATPRIGISLPGTSPGQPGHNGSTCPNRLPGRRKETAALLRQADLQAQQLLSCQVWIREQGMAK